jgi:hypothetical protein
MAPLLARLGLGRSGFGFGKKSGASVPFSATGGTITTAAGKTIHTFTSSGTFIVGPAFPGSTVDYLVIGGGGGGARSTGGGGGAGGYRTSMPEGPGGPSPSVEPTVTLSVGTYPVIVGSGGNGTAPGDPGVGGSGGNSTLTFPSVITSTGGGGGAGFNGAGATGGSGGGGGGNGGVGGSGTSDKYLKTYKNVTVKCRYHKKYMVKCRYHKK